MTSMDYPSQKAVIIEHYANSLAQAADEHQAVDSSPRSHEKRFRKMSEVIALEGASILDVGCGLGAFYSFLRNRNITCDYTGYDITASMIREARERHPEIADRFQVLDILDAEQPPASFDYVLAITPLTLPLGAEINVETTVRLVQRMFLMCRIGTGISMTSSFTRKPSANTFYYDPMEMLGRISAICRNVRLDHTYLPHDFAIFCYKSDLYDA